MEEMTVLEMQRFLNQQYTEGKSELEAYQNLDELEDWQEVRELALETNNEKILKKADQQIAKINEKIKF